MLFISLLITAAYSEAQKRPELAETPPMGWNSWNFHGKQDINEQIILETIDAIAEEGLLNAGYNYIVVDGGWRDTRLGPGGELLAHPVKFPNGIKPLTDYAHSKGLKFGVHVVPGTHDCGGDPVGGYGREEIHLKQFVEWGLDFIKMDLCKQTEDPCSACQKTNGGWSESTIEETYRKWSSLLNECGRDILFSISAYQYRSWYPEVCNMARTTGDIQSRIHRGGALFNPPDSSQNTVHYSVIDIAESNNLSSSKAGNGYWNDPDMIVTGEHGLSENEQESHFALWSIMSSPLFLGNDPRTMTEFEKKLILNREMIAVNQDPTEQGKIVKNRNNTQVWAKKLKDGKMAVLLLNLAEGDKDIQLDFKDVGLKNSIQIRDIINKKDLGEFTDSLTLTTETNQCRFLIISR